MAVRSADQGWEETCVVVVFVVVILLRLLLVLLRPPCQGLEGPLPKLNFNSPLSAVGLRSREGTIRRTVCRRVGKPLGKPWADPGQTPSISGQTPAMEPTWGPEKRGLRGKSCTV